MRIFQIELFKSDGLYLTPVVLHWFLSCGHARLLHGLGAVWVAVAAVLQHAGLAVETAVLHLKTVCMSNHCRVLSMHVTALLQVHEG